MGPLARAREGRNKPEDCPQAIVQPTWSRLELVKTVPQTPRTQYPLQALAEQKVKSCCGGNNMSFEIKWN